MIDRSDPLRPDFDAGVDAWAPGGAPAWYLAQRAGLTPGERMDAFMEGHAAAVAYVETLEAAQ